MGPARKHGCHPIGLEPMEFKSLIGLSLLECYRLTFLLVENGDSLQG